MHARRTGRRRARAVVALALPLVVWIAASEAAQHHRSACAPDCATARVAPAATDLASSASTATPVAQPSPSTARASRFAVAARRRRGVDTGLARPSTAVATSTPGTSTLGTPAPTTGTSRSLLAAGAVGDGITDDTAAIQRALDALQPGDSLVVPAGRTFAHSGILHLRGADTAITGTGTLLATDPARSALWMEGARTSVSGVTLTTPGAVRRLGTWDDVGLRVAGTTGSTVADVTVTGGASAGVMVDGADHFTLRGVHVSDTLADGIHITDASHDGLVDHAITTNTGDDGISVVSYRDLPPVHDITITSPTVRGTTWGRGISVVGGTGIHYTDVSVTGSNAAALYIGAESSWNTWAASDVTVHGGSLVGSNTSATVDHGALLIYNGDPSQVVSDVEVDDLAISDTNPQRSREVGVLADSNGPVTGVVMTRLTITGSGPATFSSNTSGAHYTFSGWTRDGAAVPDVSR